MKCMIYSSKYEAILKKFVAALGIVVVEECSLDSIFFLLRQLLPASPFVFLVAVFSNR